MRQGNRKPGSMLFLGDRIPTQLKTAVIRSTKLAIPINQPTSIFSHLGNFLFGKYFSINILCKQNFIIIMRFPNPICLPKQKVHASGSPEQQQEPPYGTHVSGMLVFITSGNCLIGTAMLEIISLSVDHNKFYIPQ